MLNHSRSMAMQWYMEEEKRRKTQVENQQISIINRQLKSILQGLQGEIEREDYEDVVRKWSRYIGHCSLWNVTYRNNLENPEVALAQAVLIQTILIKEEIPYSSRTKNEVDIQMKRLGHHDWNIYTTYSREVQKLMRGHEG